MKTIDFDQLVKILPSVKGKQVIQDHLQRFSMKRVVGLTLRHSSFVIKSTGCILANQMLQTGQEPQIVHRSADGPGPGWQ